MQQLNDCVTSRITIANISDEIKAAAPKGVLDEVFEKYCKWVFKKNVFFYISLNKSLFLEDKLQPSRNVGNQFLKHYKSAFQTRATGILKSLIRRSMELWISCATKEGSG